MPTTAVVAQPAIGSEAFRGGLGLEAQNGIPLEVSASASIRVISHQLIRRWGSDGATTSPSDRIIAGDTEPGTPLMLKSEGLINGWAADTLVQGVTSPDRVDASARPDAQHLSVSSSVGNVAVGKNIRRGRALGVAAGMLLLALSGAAPAAAQEADPNASAAANAKPFQDQLTALSKILPRESQVTPRLVLAKKKGKPTLKLPAALTTTVKYMENGPVINAPSPPNPEKYFLRELRARIFASRDGKKYPDSPGFERMVISRNPLNPFDRSGLKAIDGGWASTGINRLKIPSIKLAELCKGQKRLKPSVFISAESTVPVLGSQNLDLRVASDRTINGPSVACPPKTKIIVRR